MTEQLRARELLHLPPMTVGRAPRIHVRRGDHVIAGLLNSVSMQWSSGQPIIVECSISPWGVVVELDGDEMVEVTR